jgi:hypothetical protein
LEGSRGYRRYARAEPNDIDRDQAALARSVTELTVVVAPPALDRSFGRHRTGVEGARGYRRYARAEPNDIDRDQAALARSVTEPTTITEPIVVVASPALDTPIGRHRAGMDGARGDGHGTVAQVD